MSSQGCHITVDTIKTETCKLSSQVTAGGLAAAGRSVLDLVHPGGEVSPQDRG